jgi:DNA invertase Pin-like site-specific DNA recombinase
MPATVPARPAAYIQVKHDRADMERAYVLRCAEKFGWPSPAIYTDTGPGWNRPGSGLAALTDDIQAGRCDAVLVRAVSAISREPANVAAFSDLCASHGIGIYGPDGEISRPTIAVMAALSDNIER